MRVLGEQQWCRVVMNRATREWAAKLPCSSLDVLEISGTSWKDGGFRSFKSVDYPDFDICNQSTAETFDLVIAEQVFEHIEDPQFALSNVLSMLRPGGWFLITTPFLIRYHPFPLDLWRWTADGLRRLLERAGFVDVQAHSWGNKECLIANLDDWVPFDGTQSLDDDPALPVVVWAMARRPPQKQ